MDLGHSGRVAFSTCWASAVAKRPSNKTDDTISHKHADDVPDVCTNPFRLNSCLAPEAGVTKAQHIKQAKGNAWISAT